MSAKPEVQPKELENGRRAGLKCKVTFVEKQGALGYVKHADGVLQPNGLVRVEYHPERPDADGKFDYHLVPVSAVAMMTVYKDQE